MQKQIGELFILGFRGKVIPSWVKNFSEKFGLGGVLLFDYDCLDKKYERNIFNPAQLKELCAEIHALPSKPLIFVDQEGGKVRRLKEANGFAPLPSAKAFAKLSSQEKMSVLEKSFSEMKRLGIDFNFAPVVDLDLNLTNPDIGAIERSYSADPLTLLKCAEVVIETGETMGLGLCLKHFPGLGGAKVNSHEELTDLSDTLSEAQLDIFSALLDQIESGMILMSHGKVKQWDAANPVSLSPVAVKKVRELRSDAVIVTDDMQMGALQKLISTEDGCVQALRAGVDLVCIGNNLIDEQHLCDAFAMKLAQEAERDAKLDKNIQASIKRVQSLKRRAFSH